MLYPGNPIKSLIIEFLAEKKLVMAKEIVHEIAKYIKNGVSLQAVYKNFSTLIKEDIVTKHGYYYSLSISFLQKIRSFSSRILDHTQDMNRFSNMMENLNKRDKLVIKATNMFESLSYSMDLFSAFLLQYPDYKNIPIYRYHYHYMSYFMSKEQTFWANMANQNPIFDYFYADTPLDFFIHKISKSTASENSVFQITQDKRYEEIGVVGEYIFQMNLIRNYQDTITNFLQKQDPENFSHEEILHFYLCYYFPETIIVEKNKEKAQQIIQEMQTMKCY